MYILKNAWISITKNKGRSILVGIICSVLAISCTITLSIFNSANNLINSYREANQITASISINRNQFMSKIDRDEENSNDMKEMFQNLESITIDEIKNYGNSDFVSSYFYTESINVNVTDLEKATSEVNISEKVNKDMNQSSTDFKLMGYNSIEAMSEFLSGNYTISEGKISSDFGGLDCIINKELATLNNLKVGSVVEIINPNTSKTYKLTITGIYSDSSEENSMNLFSTSANTIITNTTVVENMINDDENLKVVVTPTYYLTSSNVIDKFSDELTTKGLSEYYSVSTNLAETEKALSSVSNLKTFSITFLILTLIIGAIILIIINTINIRERKYEIGVLRTIGMKKSLVSLQFVTELLIVSFASIIIGLGIGSVASVPTANMLLSNEIKNSSNDTQNIAENFGGMDNMRYGNKNMNIQGLANVEKVDSINAIVNVTVVFELLGMGILLTIISSLVSVISIVRFSPLTILKERS